MLGISHQEVSGPLSFYQSSFESKRLDFYLFYIIRARHTSFQYHENCYDKLKYLPFETLTQSFQTSLIWYRNIGISRIKLLSNMSKTKNKKRYNLSVLELMEKILKLILLLYSRNLALREKCPYSELFWSVFSRIRTEYGETLCIFPYSIRIRENTDQNNSRYGHFLRSVEYSK